MKTVRMFIAALALAVQAIASPAIASADKPLVLEGAKIKQLPSATTLQLQAPTTGAASINLPHGSAPSSPTNGDCWTTTAGLYCRINGATAGPYGSANIQTLLDGISSTRGTVLYRGSSAWVALSPGTVGSVLKTGGAGADPSWGSVPAGSGGAAWTEVVQTISSPTAAVTFTGLDAYSEIVLVIDAVTAAAAQNRTADFSVDGGSTWETSYVQILNTGLVTSRSVADFTVNSDTVALSLQLAIFNNQGAVKSYRSSGTVGNAIYKASANPINAIRVRAGITGTNMTGGKIYVYGR